MTPKELKSTRTADLIRFYKNKGRTDHCNDICTTVINELKRRVGEEELRDVLIERSHIRIGEGTSGFDSECDALIKKFD